MRFAFDLVTQLRHEKIPAEIDLSDDRLRVHYATATLTLNGKTYHPETLAYYAATDPAIIASRRACRKRNRPPRTGRGGSRSPWRRGRS